LRAPKAKKGRGGAPPGLTVRLSGRVALDAQADGRIIAQVDGYSFSVGNFTAAAAKRARALRTGLPLASFASAQSKADREIGLLVRRLARQGLVEYGLRRPREQDEIIAVEPQIPDYWPRARELKNTDVIVLSRFAYLRRRGNDLVLESPRADALFKITDPTIASVLALLVTPRQVKRLRRQADFPGMVFLGLLLDCNILFTLDAAPGGNLRSLEGGNDLALWDFHDLLFHTRSSEGRHANPLGGLYLHAGAVPPLPALRPRWPGKTIDLDGFVRADVDPISQFTKLLHERHSTRAFDARRPITLAELARFLHRTARVQETFENTVDLGDGGVRVGYTARPYPSGGSGYPLELYLAVDACDGLPRGFYHYDAGDHALTSIDARAEELEAVLRGAAFAMGSSAVPQIVMTIAARFGRLSWKYSSLAYSLVLKDAGVLTQTFYLAATDMGLGGCAIGIANVELFATMTGIPFHVEGPVAQFALGRGMTRSKNETAP